MAKPNHLCHFTAILFLFLLICQSSSGRPLNGLNPDSLPATEPLLNLVLAGDDNVDVSSQKVSGQNVLPCDMESDKNVVMEVRAAKKLDGRFGPLFLSSLPKGVVVPPSGPSKRTNSKND
ncbi:unnamed protein product [Ilex paraguariensis]|uniref:Uncharacterized protein n=1 Tax=Ilex paraguariensis TaxID=185542 RepID=A0ABC8QUE3_9AQUA